MFISSSKLVIGAFAASLCILCMLFSGSVVHAYIVDSTTRFGTIRFELRDMMPSVPVAISLAWITGVVAHRAIRSFCIGEQAGTLIQGICAVALLLYGLFYLDPLRGVQLSSSEIALSPLARILSLTGGVAIAAIIFRIELNTVLRPRLRRRSA